MTDLDTSSFRRRVIASWIAGYVLAGIAGSAIWLIRLPNWAVTPGAVLDRLAVAVCAVLALTAVTLAFGSRARFARRAAVIGAGAAVAAGLLAAAAIPASPPRPGLPFLGTVQANGQGARVVIVPQRPGWNLIHVDALKAAVGLSATHLLAAAPEPGAAGVWALTKLPAGRSTLYVQFGGTVSSITVNTGYAPSLLPGLTGPDGPECASAALGALVAGQHAPLRQCPSQVLTPVAAAELRGTVGFIAGRGVHHVTLVQDSSPRSTQAAQVVLATCTRDKIKVGPPGHDPSGPLIIVSGWAGTQVALQQVVRNRLPAVGAYLAPWLLDSPLQGFSAGELIPLQFDPASLLADRYISALEQQFPGEQPSESGYMAWLAANRASQAGPIHLYAASLVYDLGVDELGPQRTWLKDGTITQVSEALNGR